MNRTLTKWIFALCFIGVSLNSFSQSIEVVKYKPVADQTIGTNDSLNLILPDSVFYEVTGTALTYEASLLVNNNTAALPAWLHFVTNPLSFGGKPGQANIGTFKIVLTATSGAVSATDTFSIDVINHAPIVSVPLSGLIFAEGFASAKVDVANTFTDPDGDAMTYTVTSSATGVVTASITKTVITLTEVALGTADITVTATDSQGATETSTFTVIIRKNDSVFGFTTENTGSNGLIESWTRSIYIENNDDIWMGTDMGLSRYNPTQNSWTSTLRGGNRDDGKNKIYKILKTSTNAKCLLVLRGFQLETATGFTYYDKNNIPEIGDFVNGGAFDSNDKLWLVVWKSNELYLVRYNLATKQVELNQQLFSGTAFSHQLVIDNHDTPWISTNKGLVHYEASGITVYDHTNGLANDDVYNVAIKDGKVYFLQNGTVGIYDGVSFKFLNYDKIFNAQDGALTIDSKGDIWTSSYSYGLLHYNSITGWKAQEMNFLGGSFSFGYPVYDVNIDALNRVWVATRWGVLMYPNTSFPPSSPTVFNTYDGLPSNDVIRILKDDDGNAWFPTNLNGVSKYDGQNWTWTFRTVPFDAAIWLQNTSAAYVAKDGAIWLGGAGGLSVTTDGETWKSFTSVDYHSANSFLNMNNVMAIGEDSAHNIWVGGVGYTIDMGLNKYDGTTWKTYKEADGLKGTTIRALFGDSKGNMWVSYQGLPFGAGILTKIASDGSMTHYTTTATTPDFGFAQQILETSDGKIWVACFNGIGVFDGTTWTTFKSVNGLRSDQVSQMAMDGFGNVWVAYSPNLELGVSMYDGTKWTHFNKLNGLPSDQINSLQVLLTSSGSSGGRTQATGGTLWLGTPTEGVSRLNIDGFLGITTPPVNPPVNPPVDPPVTGLTEDDKESISIYPNPAHETVFVKVNGESQIILMDMTGRNWHEQSVGAANTIEVPVSNLKPGIYLIQLKDKGGVKRKRFVKM